MAAGEIAAGEMAGRGVTSGEMAGGEMARPRQRAVLLRRGLSGSPPGDRRARARASASGGGYAPGRWKLGLAGSAENLQDGRVKVIAEGPVARCRELLALLAGPGTPGRVTGVTQRWDDPRGGMAGFLRGAVTWRA